VEIRLLLLPQKGNAISAEVLELLVVPVSIVKEPGCRGKVRAGFVMGGNSHHAITAAAKVKPRPTEITVSKSRAFLR
jgi:hypothetical protein